MHSIRNPTQSSAGGSDTMHDRKQQASEHVFLAFPHKWTFFEHQNPYVYQNFKQEKLKKEEQFQKNHQDRQFFNNALEGQLSKAIQEMKNNGIDYNIPQKIYPFDKQLTSASTKSPNDPAIGELTKQRSKASDENSKFLDFAKKEMKQVQDQISSQGRYSLESQMKALGVKVDIPDNEKQKSLLSQESADIQVYQKIEKSQEDIEAEKSEKESKDILNSIKGKLQAYNGLHSIMPGNANTALDQNNTKYNGPIHPTQLPYYNKLYDEKEG